jgi:hypothetical protein
MYTSQVRSLKDQERLLQSILETKNNIRTEREKQRIRNEKLNLQYAMLMNPITRQLEAVLPTTTTTTTTTPQQESEETPEEIEQLAPPPDREKTLYEQALQLTQHARGNDASSLLVDSQTINNIPYSVENGTSLVLHTPEGGPELVFHNIDEHVWQLLLTNDATGLPLRQTNNLPTQTLRKYRHIIQKLNVAYDPPVQKQRDLFSPRLKEAAAAGSGLVFPCDVPTLMRDLRVYAAEYRAGNRSIVNYIVPLAAEARRLGVSKKRLAFLADIPLTGVYN